MTEHPADLTVVEAAHALRAGTLTSEDLTRACLERISARDPYYSAWIGVYEDDAIAAARAADQRLATGDARPLTGIPIGLKDVVGVAGKPLTADSAVLEGNIAPVDSTVWAKLAAEGMVLIGHLHCGEFACGTWGNNPWGPEFTAGGSSAGSGVAVAERGVPATIGSDGRGSIRIPAAFQNVTALKPSFGLVSVAGCVPITFSFDVLGPMARSAEDCALLISAMAGPDPLDRATILQPRDMSFAVMPRTGGRPLEGTRIGIPRFRDGFLASGVATVFARLQDELRGLGATLVEFDKPDNPLEENGGKGAGWQTLLGAEALAIHAQFEGRKHLYRDEFVGLFNPMVDEMGSAVDYVQAQIKRAEFVRTWHRIWEENSLDALIEPGSAAEVMHKEGLTGSADNPHPLDIEALPWLFGTWSDANFPIVSLPAGLSPTDGGPCGMQLVGLPFSEQALLQIAVDYQAATDYHSAVAPSLDDPARRPFAPPTRHESGTTQPAFKPLPSPLEGVLQL